MTKIVSHPKTWEEQWEIITQDGRLISKILLRLITFNFLALVIVSLLGVSFMLITQATLLLTMWLYRYWKPAYKIGNKIINLEHAPQELVAIPFRWYSIFSIGIRVIAYLFMFSFGIYILISNGFCQQNWILLILGACK